jgi:uncharacterized membrane protein YjjP (DUF1212 family)
MAYSMILAIYIYVAGHIFHKISKDTFNDMYICIFMGCTI